MQAIRSLTLDLMYNAIWNPGLDKPLPLAAIYLDKPLMTGNKFLTKRICEGDLVLIKDGEIVDCMGSPSHRITSLHGKAASDFSINVIDLNTLELSTVKL